MLIATSPLPGHYDEALATIDEFYTQRAPFPISRFQQAAARALILYAKKLPLSSTYATEALTHATSNQSDFARHPGLGLVGLDYASLVKHLKRIAA